MQRSAWARLMISGIVVASALGFSLVDSGDAEAETWCGYAEAGYEGTTSTATFLSFCDDWTCAGSGMGPWPGGALGITWEVFVCTDSP